MSDPIKEAANRADELIRQLADAKKQPQEEQAAPETPETVEPTAPEPVQEAPAPTPAPVQPDPNAETIAKLRNDLGLEHQRYKSLQGMFESQARQIESLNQLIANMQASLGAQQAPAQPESDDEEVFGADLVEMTRRNARAEVASEIAALREELATLRGQLGGVQEESHATRYSAFLGVLADQVQSTTGHSFDTINQDPAFRNWIESSPSRLRIFQEARQALDLDGVLTFFDMYAKQYMSTSKQETPTPPPAIDPRLARQVEPGKSSSTPSPAQQGGEKRRWTRSGIADLYSKRDSYPKETFKALEADIFAAQREGRVDYTR